MSEPDLKEYEKLWLNGLDVNLKHSLEHGFTKWKGFDDQYLWLYSVYEPNKEMFMFNRMIESEESLRKEAMEVVKGHPEIAEFAGYENAEDFIESESLCSVLTTIQDYNGWYFYKFGWANNEVEMLNKIFDVEV